MHINRVKKANFKILIAYFSLAFLCSAQVQDDETKVPIQLTAQERNWLSKHPEIRLAPDPEFLPIEYIDENGEYVGIAADFISLVEKKLGITFTIVTVESWSEVLEKVQRPSG